MTILANTRYRVIFACLYWKSQGKVREFHVVWKVVTGHPAISDVTCILVLFHECFSHHVLSIRVNFSRGTEPSLTVKYFQSINQSLSQ